MATGLENPFLRNVSTLLGANSTIDSLRDRWATSSDAVEAGNRGEYGRALLRASGDIVGTAGDLLAYPFAALFEKTGLDETLANLVRKGLDTETGQYIVNLVQENPEYAKDMKDALDIASVGAFNNLTKNFVNDLFSNMKTKVEGGTIGDVVQKTRTKIAEKQGKPVPEKPNFYNSFQPPLVAGEAVNSLFHSVNDRFNPFQRATTRASGIPTGKRKETARLLKEGKENDAVAEVAAARMMQAQRYGDVPPMFDKDSPLSRYLYLATDIPAKDLDTIASRIGGADIPEEVVARHLNDFKVSQLDQSKFQRLMNSVLPSDYQGTMVDIYNPNARNAHAEFANQPMNQAPGSALHKMFIKERMAELPEGTTPYELMKAAKAADYVNGQQSLTDLVRQGKRPNLGGKTEATKYILKALDKRKAGKPLTEKETEALKAYDKQKINKAEINRIQHGASSHTSGMKEIGGTRDVGSLEGLNKLYMSMSDKNDLFGTDFVGAKQSRASIFPIQGRNLNEPRSTTDARLERYLTKTDVDRLIPTTELERISGVAKKKGEKATNYHLRAIAEMRKTPEMRDYAEVLYNSMITLAAGMSNKDFKEE